MTLIDNKTVSEVLERLEKFYDDSKTALNYETAHEMLVATILSAQCTDDRVNKVTKSLFKKYKGISDFANAKQSELEQDVRSTGFYRNKARNIIGASKLIEERFGGEVPNKMKDLLLLPGVARKTANVVLNNAFGIVEGVVVDTHVFRLSRRLGFSDEKYAEKVEKDLMKLVPKNKWGNISYWLIDHGRSVCKARKPLCSDCFLNDICPKNEVKTKK